MASLVTPPPPLVEPKVNADDPLTPSRLTRLPSLSLGALALCFALAALLLPKQCILSTQTLITSTLEGQQRRQARQVFSQEVALLDEALLAGDATKKEAIFRQDHVLLLRRLVARLPMNDVELEAVQRVLPDLQGQLQGQSPEAIRALRRVHVRTLLALLPRAEAAAIADLLGSHDAQLQALRDLP